jgi:hydrogenase expression/formation protein HypC
MCLAIPAQISELLDDRHELAMVDIMGVRRRVNIDLLSDDPPRVGDWVLIHVGFAMSKISGEQAAEQLRLLTMLGEASAAEEEVGGYQFAAEDAITHDAITHDGIADDLADKNVEPNAAQRVLRSP